MPCVARIAAMTVSKGKLPAKSGSSQDLRGRRGLASEEPELKGLTNGRDRRSDEANAKAEDNGENRERGLNSKIFDTDHFAAFLEERRASERHKEQA